jgi:anti-anti-sigma factor
MDIHPGVRTWPTLITLPAEIDIANAGSVRNQITAAFKPGTKVVVIADMTSTTFCDTMGARALVQAHKRAASHDAELRLLSPSRTVMRVLEVLGLDHLLAIYQSLEEAIKP